MMNRINEKHLKLWSDALFLETKKPSLLDRLFNPEKYRKELQEYKKVRSIQYIKRQPFFN